MFAKLVSNLEGHTQKSQRERNGKRTNDSVLSPLRWRLFQPLHLAMGDLARLVRELFRLDFAFQLGHLVLFLVVIVGGAIVRRETAAAATRSTLA